MYLPERVGQQGKYIESHSRMKVISKWILAVSIPCIPEGTPVNTWHFHGPTFFAYASTKNHKDKKWCFWRGWFLYVEMIECGSVIPFGSTASSVEFVGHCHATIALNNWILHYFSALNKVCVCVCSKATRVFLEHVASCESSANWVPRIWIAAMDILSPALFKAWFYKLRVARWCRARVTTRRGNEWSPGTVGKTWVALLNGSILPITDAWLKVGYFWIHSFKPGDSWINIRYFQPFWM